MQLIDIHKVLKDKLPNRTIPEPIIRYLEHIVHTQDINHFILSHTDLDGWAFLRAVLQEELHCSADIYGADTLPQSNAPLLFVSNHPLGGLDGMLLADAIGRLRGDNLRIIVNDLLMALTPLQSLFAPVNLLGKQSRQYAQQQERLWQSKTDILTFPAGACSRRTSLFGPVRDLAWKRHFISAIRRYPRTIVPIYFEGHNSRFFYQLSYWRRLFKLPNIEMLYLADEMYRARDTRFAIHFFPPIESNHFTNSHQSDQELADYLHDLIYETHHTSH